MAISYLQRPGGRIAYDIDGTGPLVVCVPGMGDLRRVYRFLAPELVEAGHRVAVLDLRGHGDSDTTFDSYDDEALAGDIAALLGELGPGAVVGNSMGAGAAVIAAADRPELVEKLVLVGPFVRNPRNSAVMAPLMRAMLLRPWGGLAWDAYWKSLYPGRRPDGFDEHRAAITASLRRPGRWKAFAATARTSHAPAEARLDGVHAPTLVVMGEKDPDFPDPAAEARFIQDRLAAQVLMVPGAGHYPQAEFADVVRPALISFLAAPDA